MGGKGLETFPRLHVPDPNALVELKRRERKGVRNPEGLRVFIIVLLPSLTRSNWIEG